MHLCEMILVYTISNIYGRLIQLEIMHLIHLTVSPKTSFQIPLSDGYQLYSALLSLIKEKYPDTSLKIHNSPLPSLSTTGLIGRFEKSSQKGHKSVKIGEEYSWRIGITDPHDEELFNHIITPFLLDRKEISLFEGNLCISSMETQYQSFQDIIQKVGGYRRPAIQMDFMTPTCIQYRNSRVTEMFPNRIAVFFSILSKYNQVCPENLRLALNRDDFGRYLLESPNPQTYRTHSVLTNTIFDSKKQHPRPIFKQGFTGICRYIFTGDSPISIINASLILAHFAEYCGVGSSVSRGCGQVSVSFLEDNYAN